MAAGNNNSGIQVVGEGMKGQQKIKKDRTRGAVPEEGDLVNLKVSFMLEKLREYVVYRHGKIYCYYLAIEYEEVEEKEQ